MTFGFILALRSLPERFGMTSTETTQVNDHRGHGTPTKNAIVFELSALFLKIVEPRWCCGGPGDALTGL
jgi:hypothetical protein